MAYCHCHVLELVITFKVLTALVMKVSWRFGGT
jgi:hypothetical protein